MEVDDRLELARELAEGADAMWDLTKLSVQDLLRLNSAILEQLRQRGVTRTSDNPTGDYAEHLFCRAFGWRLAGNSEREPEAVGADGTHYQVKGRRLTRHSLVAQMGVLRDVHDGSFDYLAGVLFEEDYSVLRAALVPQAVVLAEASEIERTTSWRFLLQDRVWSLPGVRDATEELRAAADR